MTANAMPSDRDACIEAGMDDHVGKPFELDQLEKVIRRHVAGRSAEGSDAAAQAPADAQGLHVDLAAAVARLGGDMDFYRGLYPSAKADAGAMLDQLEGLLQQGRRTDATRLFHTIKGLAGTLGATALSKAAADAEHLLAGGPPDAAAEAAALEATRSAYAAACAELDERLRT
jgi:HPt (histidine-containing phosphotransfer) domain-containing protein